jgi:hypothetical protein
MQNAESAGGGRLSVIWARRSGHDMSAAAGAARSVAKNLVVGQFDVEAALRRHLAR